MASFLNALAQERDAQKGRAVLWLPVALALGAATFLESAAWPPKVLIGAAVLAFLALAVGTRRWPILARASALGAAFTLGALASSVRIDGAEHARLQAQIGPATLVGVVEKIEPGATRLRHTIRVQALEGVEAPPARVRLAIGEPHAPGRWLRCRVILRPAEPPIAPGGYDAQRRDYFQGIGGSGFALGACRPIRALEQPDLALRIAAWRRDLAETILTLAPGEGGALTAALITGDRSLTSPETNVAFRDSGLSHLLSVSGLHMALVAGLAFLILRRTLALIPPLALRVTVAKIAAGGALISCAAYLVVSGASVPAVRAFVMTAVALGAVMIDRPAFSMRGLALAAGLILLVQPEAVLDAGFQMSFTATAALIAAFETTRVKPEDRLPSPGPIVATLRRVNVAIIGSIATSLVAGLATDPIALHHFQRISIYGLPANVATAPIVSLVVAPAAIAAALAAPIGLAETPLQIMAHGMDLVRAIGVAFAARPEAVQGVPYLGGPAFVAALAAVYWFCLWRGRLRWAGLVFVGGALWLGVAAPRPVALVSPDARVALVKTDAPGLGGWRVLRPDRGGDFAVDRLASLAGLSPAQTRSLVAPDGCAGPICTWRTPEGRHAAYVRERPAAPVACATKALIISAAAAPLPRSCPATLILTPRPERGGAQVTEQPLRVTHAVPAETEAPWRSFRNNAGSD